MVGKTGVHKRPTRPNNTFARETKLPHNDAPIQGADWREKIRNKHKNIDFESAAKFFNDPSDKSFCLFVTSSQPRSPVLSEIDNGLEGYPANNWTADKQFGEFLKMLDASGKPDNTIVVFLSDNGAFVPRSKFTLYEPGVKMPFIVKWPNHIQPNTVSNQLTDFINIMPTILNILGEDIPENMDGKSMLPILKGVERPIREDVFLSFATLGVNGIYEPFPIRAVIAGEFKLIHYVNYTINHPVKGLKLNNLSEFEMYDLKNDPSESMNLFDNPSYQNQKEDLLNRLTKWKKEVGDKGMKTEFEAIKMFPEKLEGKVSGV